jgi:hypothetical protein
MAEIGVPSGLGCRQGQREDGEKQNKGPHGTLLYPVKPGLEAIVRGGRRAVQEHTDCG